MPTLHSNNPVPGNGSVATVVRGSKSISMTLSGVGAIRAVVQIMSHEDGAAPGPIGSQIVVSGTTTVTTTQTFNAEAGKVYLQLIDITPACTFSATLTDLGPIQDTNPGSPSAPYPTRAALEAITSPLATGDTAWYLDPASPIGRYEAMWEGAAWGYGYLPNLSTAPAAPGTSANPFATVEDLVAANPAGWEMPWVVNPLAPEGETQVCFCSDQGIWAPRPGQCIAQYRGVGGALLVDMTAAGRTPGTWYEVWTPTDPIPNWLLPNYRDVGFRVRAEVKETTNSGTTKLRATLRDVASSAGNETDAMVGGSAPGSEFGRGLYAGIVWAERRDGLIMGSSGTGPFLSTVGTDRPVGVFLPGATKPRLDVNFGLVSNTLKLFSVSLWSGA